ncbi:hypothetical protein MLD38_017612 [Melastoma candidum]|uniref:Uncharacterized protein n=1 Tax=Melastoma candidum TaxID=119954 RepID=A0ACB9QSA8_9MYRT|nr:hypothetical protein MLD38_017612 [Melastoma candidum]
MEPVVLETKAPCGFGDRSSSDVVVRLRTSEGRDDWLYCHSQILIEKSKYFADRLSDNWPTCQILDSRSCVEVYCQESDFDFHVSLLRLFYVVIESSGDDLWHGVRNALGILRAAVYLYCPEIVTACVNYLEAVPWEENEEEEILQTIPKMGSQALPVLSRLEPVNQSAVLQVFLSAVRFVTSTPSLDMNGLKSSAQEQLEYMLNEDDDEPLLVADDGVRSEVRECVKRLLERFNNLLEALLCDRKEIDHHGEKMTVLISYLSDLLWASKMATKLEIMRDLVICWVEGSDKVVKVTELVIPTPEVLKVKVRIMEITARVLECIGSGNVILPPLKRLHALKIWLPYARIVKSALESLAASDDEDTTVEIEDELFPTLESAFVSIMLTLPSGDQAEVLTDWLGNKSIKYPDLSEAFEAWCYRSKVAKRRLGVVDGNLCKEQTL